MAGGTDRRPGHPGTAAATLKGGGLAGAFLGKGTAPVPFPSSLLKLQLAQPQSSPSGEGVFVPCAFPVFGNLISHLEHSAGWLQSLAQASMVRHARHSCEGCAWAPSWN